MCGACAPRELTRCSTYVCICFTCLHRVELKGRFVQSVMLPVLSVALVHWGDGSSLAIDPLVVDTARIVKGALFSRDRSEALRSVLRSKIEGTRASGIPKFDHK